MLTLAAALSCTEESLNRFESTSNEREMTEKMLHVLEKHEWNSEL
jgi:ribosomal protein L33